MRKRLKIVFVSILVLLYLFRLHFANKIGIPGPVLMIGISGYSSKFNGYINKMRKINYKNEEEWKDPFIEFANIGLFFDILGVGEYYT